MASINLDEIRSDQGSIFHVENISDFLSVWWREDLLYGRERETFERYYHSYKKNFGKYMKYHYDQQTRELMDILWTY
jgi:hypothetical protein